MSLRDILASFVVEVDHKQIKEAGEGIESFKNKLLGFGKLVAEAFAIDQIREFVEGQIEAGAQLLVTAQRLGTTTDELQAMQLAAGQAGVAAESLTTGLRFLNRNISQAVHGTGEGAKIFKSLGISLKDASGVTRSSSDIMGEFADAVAAIPDPARQTEVAMKLLGRGGAELIPLLKQGGQAFKDAREQMVALGGGMSKEFVESAHKAEAANVRLKFAMTGLKSEIANVLLPAFEWLVQMGTKAVVNLRDIAAHTSVVKGAMIAFGAAMAIAAPIVTVIALGAAILYLAFDELYTLLQGGDTMIGDALGPDKKKFVDDLRKAVDELGQFMDDLNGAVGNADTGMGAFATTVVGVAKAMAAIVEAMAWLIKNAERFGSMFEDLGRGNFRRAGAAARDIGNNTDAYTKEVDEQDDAPRIAGDKANGQAWRALLYKQAQARATAQNAAPWTPGDLSRDVPMPSESSLLPRAIEPPAYLLRPQGPYDAGPGNGGEGTTTIQQTNTTNIEFHGPVTDPEATGAKVEQGTRTAQERATERLYRGHKKS